MNKLKIVLLRDLKKIIKKNDVIHYMVKCLLNVRNKDFIELTINKEKQAGLFVLQTNNKNLLDTVYSIVFKDHMAGFFAIYRCILNALYVADKLNIKSYIHVSNTHYNNSDSPNDNMFEYYFMQPNSLGCENIKNKNILNYVWGHQKWADYLNDGKDASSYIVTDNYIKQIALINRKYIHLNIAVYLSITNDVKFLLNEKKTFAIHFRGNAFNVGFKNHPVSLQIEDYYPVIEDFFSKGFEQFFLATDDEVILNSFISKYGDKCLYYKNVIRSSNGIDVHDQEYNRENDGFLKGYEVLRDMYTMASCSGFIFGLSQVTIATLIEKESRKESFDLIYCINKGIHLNDDSTKVSSYLNSIGNSTYIPNSH